MTKFLLPKLPYDYDALEPYIDAQTMEIHHTKHHQAYIDKLNAALESQSELSDKSIEEILTNINKVNEEIRQAVINHGGGFANHNLFWEIMTPNSTKKPEGPLADSIDMKFGNFENFKTKFSEVAQTRFGSGWAFLVVDESRELQIVSTSNQDSPLMQNMTPILALDVWEHAYYLKYQNKRPDYVAAWWNVINWTKVSELYNQATK